MHDQNPQTATRVDALLFLSKMCHAYQEKITNNADGLELKAIEEDIGSLLEFLFEKIHNDYDQNVKSYLSKLKSIESLNTHGLTHHITNPSNKNKIKENFLKALNQKTNHSCSFINITKISQESNENFVLPFWMLTEDGLAYSEDKNKKPKKILLNKISWEKLNNTFQDPVTNTLSPEQINLITSTSGYDPNNPISVLFDFFHDAIQETERLSLEAYRSHLKNMPKNQETNLILSNTQNIQKNEIVPLDDKEDIDEKKPEPQYKNKTDKPTILISKQKSNNNTIHMTVQNKDHQSEKIYEITQDDIEKQIKHLVPEHNMFLYNAIKKGSESNAFFESIQSPESEKAEFNLIQNSQDKNWYFSKNGHHIKIRSPQETIDSLLKNSKEIDNPKCGLVQVSYTYTNQHLLHFLSKLPESGVLKNYKKQYFFVEAPEGKKLYFIMHNGMPREEIYFNQKKENIENFEKGIQKVRNNTNNTNTLLLNGQQVHDLIFCNGGMKPAIDFFVVQGAINNQDAIVRIDNRLYFANNKDKNLKELVSNEKNQTMYNHIMEQCGTDFRLADQNELHAIGQLRGLIQKFNLDTKTYQAFLLNEIEPALFGNEPLDEERIKWLHLLMPNLINEKKDTAIANLSIELSETFQSTLNAPFSEQDLIEYNQFKSKLNETMPCRLCIQSQEEIEKINQLPEKPAFYWNPDGKVVYYHSVYNQKPVKINTQITPNQTNLMTTYLTIDETLQTAVELNEIQHQQLTSMLFYKKAILPQNNVIHKAFSEATQTLNASLQERYINEEERTCLVQSLIDSNFLETHNIKMDPALNKVIANIPDFSSLYLFNTESFPYLYKNNYDQYFKHFLERNRKKLPKLLDFIAFTIKATDAIHVIQTKIKGNESEISKKIDSLLEKIKSYNVFLAKLSLPLSELIKNIKTWNEEQTKQDHIIAYDHISALMHEFNENALKINEFRRIYEFNKQITDHFSTKQGVNVDNEPDRTFSQIKTFFSNSNKKISTFNKDLFITKLKTLLDQAYMNTGTQHIKERQLLKTLGSHYFPREQFELKTRLKKYIERIESHKENNSNNPDFAYGFTFFSKSRAASRKINYELAQKALNEITSRENNLQINITESVKTLFNTAEFKKASQKTGSKELKAILQDAAKPGSGTH